MGKSGSERRGKEIARLRLISYSTQDAARLDVPCSHTGLVFPLCVDWQLDQSLEIGFVIEMLRRTLAVNKPEILNSDQGSHFTSPQYIDILKENEIRISMDGKGRAADNIFTE